jgi:molybdate transport system substrate-binding protein
MYRWLVLGLGCALLGGCTPAAQQPTRDITVFAAASLRDAFSELGAAFEQAHPGTHVSFNFGASSQLRAQLEQGARADVFASADLDQMAAPERAGLLVGPSRVFATNRLVIVTPRDNPGGIHALEDLGRPGVKLVTSQPGVPIGQYSQAVLQKAAANPRFGADFPARVERNVVSRVDDVRAILATVQLGEADAGLVYVSDVTPKQRDQLRLIPIPDELNILASYPIAVTHGPNPDGGQAFVDFVLSPTGQATLARWHFSTSA